jgi:hypothetical protein
MKRILLFSTFSAFIILCLILDSACSKVQGSEKLLTEKRTLNGFTAIDASNAIEVEITQSDMYSVEVQADDNIIADVITTVENGTLKIEMKKGEHFTNSTVLVKVSIPKLTAISLSGASHGAVKQVKAEKLDLLISGASKLIATGDVSELNTVISGASRLDAKELISKDASVECHGASTAHIFANASLKINANGASKVTYSGKAIVTRESSGASIIAQD